MKKLSLILAAMLLGLFCARAQDAALVQTAQYYCDGKYKAAFAAAGKIVAADPSNDAAWYYMGLSLFGLEQNGVQVKGDAAQYVRKAAELDPENYWYRDRLAAIYMIRQEKELAIDQYESIRRDFPKKPEPCYQLVNLYLQDGQEDKALAMIDEIELMAGKSDPSVLTRYRILLGKGKQEEALQALTEYSEEYSSPGVLSMLGDHQMSMFNDSLALAYYDSALALDKDYAPALLGKTEAYRMTRKYPEFFASLSSLMDNDEATPEAKADYMMQMLGHSDPRFMQTFMPQLDSVWDRAVRRHPSDSSIVRGSGVWYYQTGREEKALELFRDYALDNPSDKDARVTYLQMLGACEKYPELISETEKAVKDFPGETSMLEFSVLAHYNLKDYPAVVQVCEKMIAAAPKDSAICLSAYSTMGDMMHLLGENRKSYSAYKKALKINPDYAPVLNNYAYYLAMEGKTLSHAAKMARRAAEQEPDNATYLDTLGWILHLQGKDSEAKPLFKHAMLYGGKDSSVILSHYARVLETLGEKDLAKVYYNQAKTKAAESGEEPE